MAEFIALFRGINVGRAKRIAMQELRQVFSELGYTDVRSVLNSGDSIFSSPRRALHQFNQEIHAAVDRTFGISATVIVIAAEELNAVVEQNPLLSLVTDPARHLVAFSASPAGLDPARRMTEQSWAPDAIAVTASAAYLWCVTGVLDSKLAQAFARVTKDLVTARNWTTLLKLRAASS